MTEAPHARCLVDLDAVRANAAALARRVSPAATMAVVKADGYGHGMLPAAKAALAGGADWLGVAFVDEALALRAAGVRAPMLVFLATPGADLAAAVSADVDLGVGAVPVLDAVTAAARAAGRTGRVHLKVDTGGGRGGSPRGDWPDLVEAAAKAEADGTVNVIGVWSHLACADSPGHPMNDTQLAAYRDALSAAGRAGLHPQLRHLANSAGALSRADTRFDLVRTGIAVYGLAPGRELPPRRFGLRPAMTFEARVALAKRAPAGQGVSYGHRYRTTCPVTLALVPVGYADGVPRAGTNLLEVRVGDRRRRISGTVSMDQFVVDVGDDAVSVGDPVLLFGPGDRGEPTADEWADALGTIGYEIVTRIGPRVPRVYVGSGHE